MWPVLLTLLLAQPDGRALPVVPQPQETITAIQVQGNTATPDDEIKSLAGVQVGTPFTDAMVEAVATRLRAAKRFDHVEVRKRFASIADPSQIMLVIIVDEGPVKIVMTGDPDNPTRIERKTFQLPLILPILGREDGYGITYGARFTLPDPKWMGKRSRITFPLTWGGTKQAGINLEKRIDGGVIDRVTAGASISRKVNLTYDENDDRVRLFLRGEREVTHALRLGAVGGWQRASFEGTADQFGQIEGDVTFDTRADPILARNAVYARAVWEHLAFGDGPPAQPVDPLRYAGYHGSANRTELDGRGYLGFIGQTVLAARAFRLDSDRPLPPYLRPELGGLGSLRGFSAGAFVGDTVVGTSVELVIPLTSPLKIARFGVTAFVDDGVAYNKNERFSDQPIEQGIGGSVWFAAAFFRINVSVARGSDGSIKVNAGGNVTF